MTNEKAGSSGSSELMVTFPVLVPAMEASSLTMSVSEAPAAIVESSAVVTVYPVGTETLLIVRAPSPVLLTTNERVGGVPLTAT